MFFCIRRYPNIVVGSFEELIDVRKNICRCKVSRIKCGEIVGPLELGDAWGKALEINWWVGTDRVEGVAG